MSTVLLKGMPKEKIGELNTLRILHKSKDVYQHILALEFELYYELSAFARKDDRSKIFEASQFLVDRREPMEYSESRLYLPGPKLFVRPSPSITVSTDEELQKLEMLANDHEFVQFAIQRNLGIEEFVPLLLDNVRLTLDELGIEEVQHDVVPRNIKRRKFYQRKGGYEIARVGMLHPELRGKSLRESLMESYRSVNGTLPQTAGLFDILKDYSKIIAKRVFNSR